jgi:outer membrane protein OmpA-like peptidoglycan-associated protein
MKRANSILSAAAALICAVALPATAQVLVGGSAPPSVEVNWGVLERLGPPPTLADMVRTTPRPALTPPAAVRNIAVAPVPTARPEIGGIVYKPYGAAGKVKAVATAKTAPKKSVRTADAPKPATKVSSIRNFYPATEDAGAAPVVAPPPKPVMAIEPPPAKVAGPKIALPEVAKAADVPKMTVALPPAKVEAPPVQQIARVEPISPPPATPMATPVVVPAPVVVPQAHPVSLPKPAVAAGISHKGDTVTLTFDGDSARMPDGAGSALEAMAQRMERDESLSLQLMSFADGDEASTSKARRLSLSRALEIRKVLMEHGVRSTRIEVRALGNKNDGSGPADRVDAVLAAH